MVFSDRRDAGRRLAERLRSYAGVSPLLHTRAVEPLERTAKWDRGEPPETYPTAL